MCAINNYSYEYKNDKAATQLNKFFYYLTKLDFI